MRLLKTVLSIEVAIVFRILKRSIKFKLRFLKIATGWKNIRDCEKQMIVIKNVL